MSAIGPTPRTATIWNAADKSASCVLTNGGLTAGSSGFGYQGARTTYSATTGKYYWEYAFTDNTLNSCGVATAAYSITGGTGGTANAVVNYTGSVNVNGGGVGVPFSSFVAGGVLGVAMDIDNKLIWFRQGAAGQWNGSGTANPATGTGGYSIAAVAGAGVAIYGLASSNNANGGGRITGTFDTAFAGVVPSGFSAGFPGTASSGATQAIVMVMA